MQGLRGKSDAPRKIIVVSEVKCKGVPVEDGAHRKYTDEGLIGKDKRLLEETAGKIEPDHHLTETNKTNGKSTGLSCGQRSGITQQSA